LVFKPRVRKVFSLGIVPKGPRAAAATTNEAIVDSLVSFAEQDALYHYLVFTLYTFRQLFQRRILLETYNGEDALELVSQIIPNPTR
jgi:hypothetical protein